MQQDNSGPPTTPATTAKENAAVYKTLAGGGKILRGHNAVDPNGHLVLLPGDAELPGARWRWATADDVATAQAAEAKRAAKEAPKDAPKKGGPLKAK